MKIWWKENGMTFLVIAGSQFFTGIVGYVLGRTDESKNLNLGFRRMFADDKTDLKLMHLWNKDTGLTEGIMTTDFYETMKKNSDIVEYGDGSWDFKSDVKS